MIEGGGFFYRLLKDLLQWLRGRKASLSPEQVMALRARWKLEFEDKIYLRRKEGLRCDVIVRDVKRVDSYPDTTDPGNGISPWFKVGLVGTYHRGIMVGLNWIGLVQAKGKWRLREKGDSDEDSITTGLIGYIPYENIVSVDWEGDEFYGHPHIYCYFDARNKEPYEKLAYCIRRESEMTEWYSEIVTYEEVRRNSKHATKQGYA